MTENEIQERLLYRDAMMLVIDKPAGLPVHPGAKGGETLFQHLDSLRFGLPRRPEVAHRLDKDTSGCLVLGRHAKALARLGDLFKRGEVDKIYWAVVEGGPAGQEGEIDLALAPKSPERSWRMKVDPKGQPALTRWRVIGRGEGLTLLELRPSRGGLISCASIAPRQAGRSWATRSTARCRSTAARVSTSMPGASLFRSIRKSRPFGSRRRCRCICKSR